MLNLCKSAFNFRAVLLVGLSVALSYATMLLVAIYLYRKGYGILGKPELALRPISKGLASMRSRTRAQRAVDAGV